MLMPTYSRQNEIEELPESLVGLGNLEELYLSSNRLQFVPEQIGCLKKLVQLQRGIYVGDM